MTKRLTALALALVLALALAACGGNNTANNGGSNGADDTQPPVTDNAGENDTADDAGEETPDDAEGAADLDGVTINYPELSFTAFGQSEKLQPVGMEGTYAATFTSSNEDVAVVDLEGNVTATGVGSATITLHVEGNGGQKDLTCAVTCAWEDDLPRLNRTDFTLKNVGDSFRLQIQNLPEGAEMGTWSISDEKVATIAEDGTVTAVGGGRATASIEVELGGETLTLTCIVRCSAPAAQQPEDGAEGSTEEPSEGGESDAIPTLSDFYNTLSETYQIGGLATYEGELLDNYYPGLSAISTKQCLVQETMMTMANAAVSLIEVENSSDVQTVKDILAARAKAQADGGAWYPASCETWANAVIVSTGNYVGMFVYPENAQAMADLFVSTYGG